MARHLFGLSPSDFAMEKIGLSLQLVPGATGTVWDALTSGTQITDLTDLNAVGITTVTADSNAQVAFYGPDGVGALYVDFGIGFRFLMTATDLGSQVDSLQATKLDLSGGTMNGAVDVGLATDGTAFSAGLATDTAPRMAVDSNGKITLGDGTGAGDVSLYRDAAGRLHTDGNITVAGKVGIGSITTPSNQLDVIATGQGGFFKSTQTTNNVHALTAYMAGTSGDNAVAGNFTSDNVDSSVVYIAGKNTNRAVTKISHTYNGVSAANVAAIGIYLQGSGTDAQGIRLEAIDTPTASNLLELLNNGRDDFVVKGSGKVGIRVATAHVPAGALEIAQADDSTVGLAMTANSGSAQQLILLKDSGGNSRFEVNAAGNTVHRATAFFTGSLQVGATTTDLGGGAGVISVKNATTVPTTNPSGGVIVYPQSGVLKWRDPSGNVFALDGTATGAAQPSDNGLLGWSYDPCAAVNNSVPTTGKIYLVRMRLTKAATITNLLMWLATAPTGTAALTSTQNLAALFDSTGTQVGITADQSTAWTTVGAKTMALTTPYAAAAGTYYVGLLMNGTPGTGTLPAFSRSVSSGIDNIGLSAGNYRFASSGSAQTAMPSSIVLSGTANEGLAFWAALS